MKLCGIDTNPMQTHAYQLVLPRFPLTQFFSTTFVMPDIELPTANVATPFSTLPFAGDKPIYSPMVFEFIVNEGMSNYLEVLGWMKSIGFDESYDQFRNYQNKEAPHQSLGEQDAKVIILSNKGNAIKTVTFFDAIPISLGRMTPFTSQDSDTSYVKASVTMAYSRFEFNDL